MTPHQATAPFGMPSIARTRHFPCKSAYSQYPVIYPYCPVCNTPSIGDDRLCLQSAFPAMPSAHAHLLPYAGTPSHAHPRMRPRGHVRSRSRTRPQRGHAPRTPGLGRRPAGDLRKRMPAYPLARSTTCKQTRLPADMFAFCKDSCGYALGRSRFPPNPETPGHTPHTLETAHRTH